MDGIERTPTPVTPHTAPSQAVRHGLWLWTLWTLFIFRVAAQLLQYLHPVAWLPPFDSWHSATLPYPLLLAIQAVIIVLLARIARRVQRGAVRPRPRLGNGLRLLGGLYFAAMLARLALGCTVLSGHPWFDKPVPSLFHLVLAGFLLALAAYHRDSEVRPDAEKRA